MKNFLVYQSYLVQFRNRFRTQKLFYLNISKIQQNIKQILRPKGFRRCSGEMLIAFSALSILLRICRAHAVLPLKNLFVSLEVQALEVPLTVG